MKKVTKRPQIAVIIFLLVFTFGSLGGSPRDVYANPLPPGLLALIKVIVINGAKHGMDKIGEYYLGSAWKPLKLVMEPVFKAYPDLKKGGERAENAAQSALSALSTDPHLLAEIEERFLKLEAQQSLILEKLRMFELVVEDHERRIRNLEQFASTGKYVTPSESEGRQYLFEPFGEALQAFIDAADDSNFRSIQGDSLETHVFDAKIYLPGAESCRVILPTARTGLIVADTKEEVLKRYYPQYRSKSEDEVREKLNSFEVRSGANCTMFNGIIPLYASARHGAEERRKATKEERRKLETKERKKLKLMAELIYQEMTSKVRLNLPKQWEAEDIEYSEKLNIEGAVQPGKPTVSERIFSSPDGKVIRVKLRLYTVVPYGQYSVQIEFHPSK